MVLMEALSNLAIFEANSLLSVRNGMARPKSILALRAEMEKAEIEEVKKAKRPEAA